MTASPRVISDGKMKCSFNVSLCSVSIFVRRVCYIRLSKMIGGLKKKTTMKKNTKKNNNKKKEEEEEEEEKDVR